MEVSVYAGCITREALYAILASGTRCLVGIARLTSKWTVNESMYGTEGPR